LDATFCAGDPPRQGRKGEERYVRCTTRLAAPPADAPPAEDAAVAKTLGAGGYHRRFLVSLGKLTAGRRDRLPDRDALFGARADGRRARGGHVVDRGGAGYRVRRRDQLRLRIANSAIT
jgi:hypothetical protein